MAKGGRKRRLLIGNAEQVLVGYDNKRIDVLGELFDAAIRSQHAALTFKVERLGDNTDGQDALLLGGARDNRRSARAGTTAHAGRDEYHVGTGQMIQDFRQCLFGRTCANLRLRPGTEALRQFSAHLDAPACRALQDCLRVRVGHHELNPFKVGLDHVVDRIAPCATNAKHGNARLEFCRIRHS